MVLLPHCMELKRFLHTLNDDTSAHVLRTCIITPQMESQRRQSEVALRRAAFTAAQLDPLPTETPCYRGIGRAYVLFIGGGEVCLNVFGGGLAKRVGKGRVFRSAQSGLRRLASFNRAQITLLDYQEIRQTHTPPHSLPTLRMHPYRYFLQPKEEVMNYLESGIKTCDSELKRLTSSREGLVQAQEALKKELLELTRA